MMELSVVVQTVPDAYGGTELVVNRDVTAGEVVLRERATILSLPNAAVDQLPARFNQRFAWSMVERLLRPESGVSFSTMATLLAGTLGGDHYVRAIVDPQVLDGIVPYARNTLLVESTWEAEDEQVIQRLLQHYPERTFGRTYLIPYLLYQTLVTNTWVCDYRPLPGAPPLQDPAYWQPDLDKLKPNRQGFFPLGSRINHSCLPNVRVRIPVVTAAASDAVVEGWIEWVALQSITAGDPVTAHYPSPPMTIHLNQETNEICMKQMEITDMRTALWEGFKIRCQCPVCKDRCGHLPCREQPATKHCARCQQVPYCGPDCQRADWKERHKKECVAVAVNNE